MERENCHPYGNGNSIYYRQGLRANDHDAD